MTPYVIAITFGLAASIFAWWALRPGPPITPPREPGRHRAVGLDDPTAKVDPLLARPMWPSP